jgi:mannose-6-phosphate isomerase-like protein (cupin superfamily)
MNYKPANSSKKIVKKDYSKEILFSLQDFKEKGHLLQVVTIPPNTRQRLHHHIIQTEVYFIVEGETIISINGKDHLAKPGDAFINHPGDKHSLWNKTGKDFKLAVFKINMPDDSDDTVWLED